MTYAAPVKRRAVFFIGGYDPKSPDAFFKRLEREGERFEALWGVDLSHGEIQQVASDITAQGVKARSQDGDWQVETDFHFHGLDDIVLKDFSASVVQRLARYGRTVLGYFGSGTAFFFARHAWRFFLYFLYPLITLLLALALTLVLGIAAAQSIGFMTGIGVAMIVGGTALWLIRTRTSVLHLADLWSFSHRFALKRRLDMEAKLDRLADTINATLATQKHDEVLLIGHSTGGALMLDAAARCHSRSADYAKHSDRVTILTLGSTALKVGAYPAAQWFRDGLKALFDNTATRWVEYQCLTDAINFYRTNPAILMGLEAPITTHSMKIKHMLTADTYKRIKRNLFRVHYQFVFGNTKRYHYDFPAICFGPTTITARVLDRDRFSNSLTGHNP
ncbi:MAG: lipase [Pseudomonadota bacterium]